MFRCTSSEIEASQTEMQSGSNNEQTVPTSGSKLSVYIIYQSFWKLSSLLDCHT